MPFQTNPFYTGGDKSGAGAAMAIAKLGESLFGGGDPMELAKAQALGVEMAKNRADAALKQDELQSKTQGLGDILAQANGDPEAFRAAVPGIIAMANRAGIKDFGNILNAQSAFLGDDSLARAGMISAGKNPTADFALDMGRADAISARDAAESLRQANSVAGINNSGAMARMLAGPRSLEQRLGDVFNALPEDQQRQMALAKGFGGITPRNVILPGAEGQPGDTTVAIGNMFLDKEGNMQPLPYGSRVFTSASTGAGPGAATGWGTTARNDLETGLVQSDLSESRLEGILQQLDDKYLQLPYRAETAVTGFLDRMGVPIDQAGQENLAEYSRFAADTINQFNLALKAQTGTAVSPGEADRIKMALPTVDDGPVRFRAKLEQAIAREKASQRRLMALRQRGISAVTDEVAAQFPLEGFMEGGEDMAAPPAATSDGWSIERVE